MIVYHDAGIAHLAMSGSLWFDYLNKIVQYVAVKAD